MPQQVFLIKEASQGTRLEIAKELASQGCKVFVTQSKGSDSIELKKAAEECADLIILPLVIESETSMQIALERIAAILREKSIIEEVHLSVMEPVRTYRITHEIPVAQ
ncbi:MAG: hypothetical protein JSR58_00965 [Verrucomicrobia bacterium]|nr:hypothetical protein [Verrucomicrobiota bacterium]